MNLCVIPARGGSKRIPRKNIRQFCGKPMIAWSIRAAQLSGCFDQVIVSTDDEEIAELARQCGGSIPFMRPAELADDFSGTMPVIAHAIHWYQNQGQDLEAICCLYATAPFVKPFEIREGLEMLTHVFANQFVFTAAPYASAIERAIRINSDSGEAYMSQPDQFSKRSQDLEPAFHDAGQFYWGRPQAWLHSENLFDGGKPLLLPRWRVQDIDTEDDWTRAELMSRALSQETGCF